MEMSELTTRQREVLEFIYDFMSKTNYSPSISEIAESFGMNLKTIYEFLEKLEEKGYIEREKRKSRSIKITEQGIESLRKKYLPIVGTVAAGMPIFSEVDMQGEIVVDKARYPGEKYFSLKISGLSMIDAGILEGDYVIIDPTQEVKHNDIVVVMIDGEVTVKRLIIEKEQPNEVILRPENDTMKDIIVRSRDLRVIGKVVGVQRFYH